MREVRINLNEAVKFKLTDKGKDIFYHQHDVFNKRMLDSGRRRLLIEPHFPKEDAEGYTTMQLWQFMNLYGTYMDTGFPNVIENLEIIYADDETTVL